MKNSQEIIKHLKSFLTISTHNIYYLTDKNHAQFLALLGMISPKIRISSKKEVYTSFENGNNVLIFRSSVYSNRFVVDILRISELLNENPQ